MKDWERMCVLASLVNMFFLVQVHGATQNSAWEFPGTLAERRCHRCVHPPNDACEARTNMGIAKQCKGSSWKPCTLDTLCQKIKWSAKPSTTQGFNMSMKDPEENAK